MLKIKSKKDVEEFVIGIEKRYNYIYEEQECFSFREIKIHEIVSHCIWKTGDKYYILSSGRNWRDREPTDWTKETLIKFLWEQRRHVNKESSSLLA